MPAGPSEVMVIADDSANASFIALDLLAQAEHDPNAQAVLLCTSPWLIAAVATEVRARIPRLARHRILEQSITAMRLIAVPDLKTALEIADEYAPEHLLIETREPRELLPFVNNAGSVFLGAWSPEPMGDYCSGTNHVLPTYGYARCYSGLSVNDFTRRMTVQELSTEGLRQLGPTAVTLAELEGLGAHAEAVRVRLNAIQPLELPSVAADKGAIA
jgi:histidinol dehydrogenase